MASVLSARDIPVHTEAAVDPSSRAAIDRRWEEGGDARPEYVVEGGVDDPVKVMGKDALVPVVAEGCIRKEPNAFAGSDDGFALCGREDVGGNAEIGNGGMGPVGYWWAGRGEWDTAWSRSIEDGGVVIGGFAEGPVGSFNDTERAGVRGRRQDRLV
jgi:hypothetical protein